MTGSAITLSRPTKQLIAWTLVALIGASMLGVYYHSQRRMVPHAIWKVGRQLLQETANKREPKLFHAEGFEIVTAKRSVGVKGKRVLGSAFHVEAGLYILLIEGPGGYDTIESGTAESHQAVKEQARTEIDDAPVSD